MTIYRSSGLLFPLAILFSGVSVAQEEETKSGVGYANTRQALEDAKTLKYTLMFFQEGDDDAMDVGAVERVEHRTPSFWRHTALDEKGSVKSIHIVDTKAEKQLYLDISCSGDFGNGR